MKLTSLVDEDSQKSNTTDAAALVVQHGWTVEQAAELTGADPEAIEDRLTWKTRLPWCPTPTMIQAECEAFKRLPPG